MKSKFAVCVASLVIISGILQTRCHAMLVTPISDSEAVDVVHETVTRRLASRVSIENVERAKEAESTARATVLNSAKRAAPDVPLPTPEELSGGYSLSQYAALAGVAAIPAACVLGLWWMTRHTLKVRERERRATLRLLRLPDPDEKPRVTPSLSLERFLALAAKLGQGQTPETPLP